MKNKNSTTRFFVSLGVFASLATVACSGGGGGNTNLTAKSDPTYASKWDTFSDVVGLPHLDQMPDLTQPDEVKKSLSTPPGNFQATDKNQAQYQEVLSAVGDYIQSQAPNMQTTKVISIDPYASRLNSTEVKSQRLDFMTMPYVQRGGSYSDLSAIKTTSGLDAESNFEIYHTQNGQVVLDNTKTTKGKVYLITYQTGGKADQNYMALVSVPNGASSTNQKPLMIFAHGGDGGLTFKELAFLLQDNLGKFVVAAPVYPGEPICAGGFTQGSESNNYTRSCTDVNGNPVAPSIAPMGSKSPVNNDVNGLLALANGIAQLAANGVSGGFYSGQNNIFYDQNGKDSIVPFNNPDDPTRGVKTIGAADSRGGATLMAAIGRAGLLAGMSSSMQAPAYFSGLALIGSPASFLVGQFRFMVQHFIHGVLPPDFKGLPMVPEFMNYFEAYRNAPAGSEQEQTELKKLVGWIAASDIAFLAPYTALNLRNWTTFWAAMTPAPAAVALFHGTSDTVVPFTESVIAKNAFDTLFMNVYGPSANTQLTSGSVTPPGTHMFSFQKDEAYLSDPKATDHALAPSFLTGHILNQSLQQLQSENTDDLRNAVLFGTDSKDYSLSQGGSLAEQFSFYNKAFQKNVSPKLSPFIISQNCSVLKNGSCYLYSLGFGGKDHQNVPLYNRTILQDTTAGVPAAMYSGTWDKNAQRSQLTPTDVLSAWLDYAILDPNAGVLQDLSSL